MSIALLGPHFDIHTGGVDHRQLHHVNEIAQSEAYLGDGRGWVPPWVRYWLHNEFLQLGGLKMAKSAGGAPRLADLTEAGYHPAAFRLFLLGGHYRSQLDFTTAAIDAAQATLRRLAARAQPLRPLPDSKPWKPPPKPWKPPRARLAIPPPRAGWRSRRREPGWRSRRHEPGWRSRRRPGARPDRRGHRRRLQHPEAAGRPAGRPARPGDHRGRPAHRHRRRRCAARPGPGHSRPPGPADLGPADLGRGRAPAT